ncbi:Uncharacterised protein [Corynebacterium amycolatum]|nr:Uncharacterised protein [Corynebacterium amycolatum]
MSHSFYTSICSQSSPLVGLQQIGEIRDEKGGEEMGTVSLIINIVCALIALAAAIYIKRLK